MNIVFHLVMIFLLGFSLTGCDKAKTESSSSGTETLITVTRPTIQSIPILQETIGTLESIADPMISAEIAGKIEKIYVQPGSKVKKGQVLAKIETGDLALIKEKSLSEVGRLESLIGHQRRTVKRYEDLLKDKFISQSILDEALSRQEVLEAELLGAKANLAIADRSLLKTNIFAPFNARIEELLVSEGSYVKVAEPVFQIVMTKGLRANLPFPESAAPFLKKGQKVFLSTPTSAKGTVEGVIREIKPLTGVMNRAVMAVVDIHNHRDWKPGSSVNAAVITSVHPKALMLPEQSIVLRPAGPVVYVIRDGKAHQQIVQTGVSQSGQVEVTSDLSSSAIIAKDGAGFLTDKALVKIQKG